MPNFGTQEPQKDFRGAWQTCRPETAAGFSAVGYFFGRQLHLALGVPVGLINDAWGGSACEAWIRRDVLAADPKFALMLKRWEQIEKDYPRVKAEYDSKLAEWKLAAKKAKDEGKQPPRPPQNPEWMMNGNFRPGNIYNGVLKPTIGYGIRGVIWYQGESNAGKAYQYRDLFPLMIKSWRDEWGQGDFSFYWVQLADFLPESAEPQRQRLGRASRGADHDHEPAAENRRGGHHRPGRSPGHPSQEQAGCREPAGPLGPGA